MSRRVAAGLAVLCLALPVLSEETPRPRVGLALGGGGARGMAHIGVIRELEALRVPIDYIAGTSMGAVVGGLYACGYTPDEMEKLIKSIDWDTLFQDAPDRPEQSFRRKEDDFDHLLPIEFGVGWKKGLVVPPGLIAGSKLGFVLRARPSRAPRSIRSTICASPFAPSPQTFRPGTRSSSRRAALRGRSGRAWRFRRSSPPWSWATSF